MHILWLVIFWVMQAVAQVLFKYGSGSTARWLPGFIGGNVFGASSIWILMVLYKTMNPNVALGVGIGGGFLCAQVAVAVIFRSSVSVAQCGGIAAIALGMVLLAAGKP